MPGWFCQLLVGPSHLFNTLRGELANLDDWGVVVDAMQFRHQDDELSTLYAQQESVITKIDVLRFVCTLTQSQLEAAQIHSKVEYLKGTTWGVAWHRSISPPRGAWKKKHSQETVFVRDAE
jgi:hypothetical protein